MQKEMEQELIKRLGKVEAKKIIKLQNKCDKFLFKFKDDMNTLLKPHNLEVLCGVAYQEVTQTQE